LKQSRKEPIKNPSGVNGPRMDVDGKEISVCVMRWLLDSQESVGKERKS
jgi:hypothetical protein